MNDPRFVGYATAMRALRPSSPTIMERELEIAELGIAHLGAPFNGRLHPRRETSRWCCSTNPARSTKSGGYIAKCSENGWTLFLSGPQIFGASGSP